MKTRARARARARAIVRRSESKGAAEGEDKQTQTSGSYLAIVPFAAALRVAAIRWIVAARQTTHVALRAACFAVITAANVKVIGLVVILTLIERGGA